MQFLFKDEDWSGWMALTGPATSRLLLLTDAGHDAVHVIDVAGRVYAGYVSAPGTIAGPRGVAARGSLVAVGNMCEKALAGAQGTFDGHAATICESLPIEEPALRNALASARDDAALAMEGLPVDGGFRFDTLARLDAYVASVAEHVTLDNATASTNQCRGVWAEQVRQLEAQLGAFKSVEELNAAVAAKRLELRSTMVGPYRDSNEMADEVASWVLSALTSLGHRLGMEQATLDAE
jgi:hypothetical protein